MRVFNLTDVHTPRLKQHGLMNQSIAIGHTLIAPGDSADFEGTPVDRMQMQHALKVGAVSVDALPKHYADAKAAPVKVTVADVVAVSDSAPVVSRRKSS